MAIKFGATLHKWLTILMAGACLVVYQNCGDVKISPLPANYPRVTLKVMYCPQNGNKLRNFFGRNRSAVAAGNNFEVDQDRDGLSDNFERGLSGKNYGSAQALSDANQDGYSDFAMVKAGYDLKAQSFLPKCQTPGLDSDGDGVSDCDESLFHTDPMKADTDGDGIPDGWEIYSGTNPLDPNDAEQDSDFDSIQNVAEVRAGTPTNETNKKGFDNVTYGFSTSQDPQYSDACSLLTVTNIPVVDVPNGNLLQLDVLETTPTGQETMQSVKVVISSQTQDGQVFNDHIGPTLLKPKPAGAN